MTTTGFGPIGSSEYMEPDIIWGETAVRSSDIWSLGVTLHVALTGNGVYGDIPDGNVVEAFRHVLHNDPELDTNLAAPYRDVLTRCLQTRAERYPTAAAFADELEAAVGART